METGETREKVETGAIMRRVETGEDKTRGIPKETIGETGETKRIAGKLRLGESRDDKTQKKPMDLIREIREIRETRETRELKRIHPVKLPKTSPYSEVPAIDDVETRAPRVETWKPIKEVRESQRICIRKRAAGAEGGDETETAVDQGRRRKKALRSCLSITTTTKEKEKEKRRKINNSNNKAQSTSKPLTARRTRRNRAIRRVRQSD